MKHKFKMKCFICDTWSNEYTSVDEKIICDKCLPTANKKLKEKAELSGHYIQTSIFDFIDNPRNSEVIKYD